MELRALMAKGGSSVQQRDAGAPRAGAAACAEAEWMSELLLDVVWRSALRLAIAVGRSTRR